MSYLLRGVAAAGGVRVIAADTTELVEYARVRHGMAPTATAALGRTLTGALLLSHVLLKNPQDRVTLRLRGDGPLGGVIADADVKLSPPKQPQLCPTLNHHSDCLRLL